MKPLRLIVAGTVTTHAGCVSAIGWVTTHLEHSSAAKAMFLLACYSTELRTALAALEPE